MEEVLNVINMIKEVHDNYFIDETGDVFDIVFQNGYCYYFATLLKKFFPNGKLYLSHDQIHIVLNIDGVLYDNLGFLYNINDSFHPLDDEDWFFCEIHMLPTDKEEREKLESVMEEIYKKVLDKYFNNSENILRKKLD